MWSRHIFVKSELDLIPPRGHYLKYFYWEQGWWLSAYLNLKEFSTPPGCEPRGSLPSSNTLTTVAPSRETSKPSGNQLCSRMTAAPNLSWLSSSHCHSQVSVLQPTCFHEKEREPDLAEWHKLDGFRNPTQLITSNHPKFLKHWKNR